MDKFELTSRSQLDITKQLVEWVMSKDYAYVEVNTYPRPPMPDHVSKGIAPSLIARLDPLHTEA